MKIFYSRITVENELHFVLFKHTALKRRIQKTGHDEGDSGMLLTFYSLPQRPGNSVLFYPDKHLNMFQCIQKLCTVGRFVNTQVDKMTLSLERNPISSKPQETKTQMFSLYPTQLQQIIPGLQGGQKMELGFRKWVGMGKDILHQ